MKKLIEYLHFHMFTPDNQRWYSKAVDWVNQPTFAAIIEQQSLWWP